MKVIIIILTLFFSSTILAFSQDSGRFSLKAGNGYFGNVWFKQAGSGGEFDGYNPRLYETHNGSGLFFECSYKFDNNYSLGVKFLKADTKRPYNDDILKEILYDYNSIASYNSYEVFFAYNFNIKKHNLLLGVGPVMCKLNESFYNGTINEFYTDEWGFEYGKLQLYNIIILERHIWDMGINPKIDYEYMINPSIGVGVKAEAYLLAYLGLSYVFVSPTIVFKY